MLLFFTKCFIKHCVTIYTEPYNVLLFDRKCLESNLSLFLNHFAQTHPLTIAMNNEMNTIVITYVTTDCSWVEGHPLTLQMRRKIQQTMFGWVCELQTPKPENDC